MTDAIVKSEDAGKAATQDNRPTWTRERIDLVKKVERLSIPEPNTGCWLWLGTVLTSGYGQLKMGGARWLAHRASFFGAYGTLPADMEVRHRACAMRACVNPDHLAIGTAKDNADDRERDGHTARGERSGTARLTAGIVRDIRESATREASSAIAERHGVSRQTVWHIITRKTWGHV